MRIINVISAQKDLTSQNDLEKVKYESAAEITKAKVKIIKKSLMPLLMQRMYIENFTVKCLRCSFYYTSKIIMINK